MSSDIIERLQEILEERKDADPKESYVAHLYKKGPNKMAKKIGEEAVEVAIEAVRGKKKKIREESADLLFHLMVMWSHYDIKPEDIFEILEERFGTSGHDEKASRKDDD
ncbi:MAG: phosphoribosyl-ATP diphosphatase [Pseudomonadota bacterium]